MVQMLSVRGNKKLVQAHVEESTGKKVLLRDLHNLSSTLKCPDNINDLLQQLKGDPGLCSTAHLTLVLNGGRHTSCYIICT